jgi:ribosomal protein L33
MTRRPAGKLYMAARALKTPLNDTVTLSCLGARRTSRLNSRNKTIRSSSKRYDRILRRV